LSFSKNRSGVPPQDRDAKSSDAMRDWCHYCCRETRSFCYGAASYGRNKDQTQHCIFK
jgi:hypothetical protein